MYERHQLSINNLYLCCLWCVRFRATTRKDFDRQDRVEVQSPQQTVSIVLNQL